MKQVLNDRQKSAVERIVKTYTYGDLVPNKLLSEMLVPERKNELITREQADREKFAYMSALEGVKDHLLEQHKLMLINSRGNGYVIVKPSEQVSYAIGDFFKVARKAAAKCGRRINNVDQDSLTKEQRERDSDSCAAFAKMRVMIDCERSDLMRLSEGSQR